MGGMMIDDVEAELANDGVKGGAPNVCLEKLGPFVQVGHLSCREVVHDGHAMSGSEVGVGYMGSDKTPTASQQNIQRF
jgi:hypothetical protein